MKSTKSPAVFTKGAKVMVLVSLSIVTLGFIPGLQDAARGTFMDGVLTGVFSLLWLPANALLLMAYWEFLIKPPSLKPNQLRLLFFGGLVYIAYPSWLLYSFFADPKPGYEFFAFMLPIFFIPIYVGSKGVAAFFQKNKYPASR